MTLLFVYLFIALFTSALCSIMEAVLLSTPQSALMAKIESGKKWASTFLQYKKDIDKPLSAILTLNTVAHTIGAAGVGAQSIKVFGETYFGVVSAVMTILILVFTEIIPKTFGARYWKMLLMPTTRIIQFMIIITYPLVLISVFITKMISSNSHKNQTSREEIIALTRIAREEGVFDEKEHKIIKNILRLKEVNVSEIMTPRVVLAIADENCTLEDFLTHKDNLKFSRIPVYAENTDNISGYVLRQKVFEKLAKEDRSLSLKDIKRDISILPGTSPIYNAWESLMDNKEHISLVVDEYGGVEGIVTMEDIIETILGLEIVDEKDTIRDMQKYARERWENKLSKYDFIEEFKEKN
jgi:CBS domain containing-hemolysin-like protein